MEFDITNGHVRQIQLERLPVRTVVEGDEDAEFRSRVEQTFAIWILTHDARGPIGRNAVLPVSQTRPGLSVVIRAINVWLVVAKQPTINGIVSRAFPMRRGLDVLHAPARRKIFRGHVGPGLPVVARDMEGTIVGTHPNHAFFERRLRNRVERAVELFAGNVASDRLAASALTTTGMRRKIR